MMAPAASSLLRPVVLDDLPARPPHAIDAETLNRAAAILEDITARGSVAALEHAHRLGDLHSNDSPVHDQASLSGALGRIPPTDRTLLERTAERIHTFAEAQRACLTDLSFPIPGGHAGHTCIPVQFAGCYAPGGRFSLPSSVLMTAVTARAAGVESVWVASPRPTDATLAAAAIAGADGLLAIGGVQAIASLARGLLGAPACDMIVGPGNRWVTAAKQLLGSEVGIDMLAGPSELVVLADETADAATVALDLLAQAEHDTDAVPILVSTCARLIDDVDSELRLALSTLPTASTARAALANGFSLLAPSLAEACHVCDRIAPEHLELHVADAPAAARLIRNAGSIFIGAASAEVLGDYGAGPNHVLPTSTTSRFRAGLSVFTFLRPRTWIHIHDAQAASPLCLDAAQLARIESLEGHARSAERRVVPRTRSSRPPTLPP